MRVYAAEPIPEESVRTLMEQEESYNLAVIPEGMPNSLQNAWFKAYSADKPFYIADEAGQIWYINVDHMGIAITIHQVIPAYEIQEGYTEYKGPNAWDTLDDALGRYQIIPLEYSIRDSSIQAHMDIIRNPIWLKAVQRLVNNHMKRSNNPYKE